MLAVAWLPAAPYAPLVSILRLVIASAALVLWAIHARVQTPCPWSAWLVPTAVFWVKPLACLAQRGISAPINQQSPRYANLDPTRETSALSAIPVQQAVSVPVLALQLLSPVLKDTMQTQRACRHAKCAQLDMNAVMLLLLHKFVQQDFILLASLPAV